jgi:hypothetical protein
MVVYWLEAGSQDPEGPSAGLDRLAVAISEDGVTWKRAREPLIYFRGSVGVVRLFETAPGAGILVFEEDGVLKSILCRRLSQALAD